MERRLWIKTAIGNLYPHLYCLFVGPPGVGKTVLTHKVRTFLMELTDLQDKNSFHLAAASLTYASLIDDLQDAERRFFIKGLTDFVKYNSLTIVSNELGVLLPEYDPIMMSKLTDLYDAHSYSERRRGTGSNFVIENPQIGLLAATTPSFLVDTLPPGAWDQGFLSRSMIIFSSQSLYRDLFFEVPVSSTLESDLTNDLRHIFSLYGKMSFSAEAIEFIQTWDKNGRQPLPDHPKLIHYNTRRAAHLLKLSMVAAIADQDTLTITREHVDTALGWLIEMEYFIPDIFKAMNNGGDSRVMEELWYHANMIYNTEKRAVSEGRLVAYLAERLPAYSVERVLQIMVKTGVLIEEATGNPGNFYVPRTKRIN